MLLSPLILLLDYSSAIVQGTMHTSYISLITALAGISQVTAKPCNPDNGGVRPVKHVQLGPRPYYLVDNMEDSQLKRKLNSCKEKEMKVSPWVIAHRGGACMQFPEHSLESNMAGARMGAGILECDVSFTKDRELVCRHSNCDLHTTTNIVNIPELNAKCTKPFQPAKDGKLATAQCCTSDITLAEYKSLCSKMDGFNATATNPKDYLSGTPAWRTDLYNTCATTMTLKEHIKLTEDLGLKHTPELKTPQVKMPFEGDYTQEKYAQQLIDTFVNASVPASRVYLQSFLYADILYWLKADTEFGKNAMYLDANGDKPGSLPAAAANLTKYAQDGVRFIAPPLNYLLSSDNGTIVASDYANKANQAGLKIITWSLERSGPLAKVQALGDSYYRNYADAIHRDGDMFRVLDALYHKVGVVGIFSDWVATTSYFANCFKIDL